MPSPSSSLATLRPDLGSLHEFNLEMDRMGFIGLQVLPVIDVAVAAGAYGIIPIEQLLMQRDTIRAAGAPYARGKWTFEPGTFATQENGAEEPVDDNQAAIYAEYFSAEAVSAKRALDIVLRNQEIRSANLVFNATTWTGSALTTGVSIEWSTIASAIPVTDINNARQKVWDGTGIWPDTLVINRKVFNNLRNCAQVIDRITSSGAGDRATQSDITLQQLAQVFDLPKIRVAGSAKNTADDGQSASLAQIWSDEYAMVCKTTDDADISDPALGRTFHYSEDGSQIGGTMESYRDETVRGDVIRARHQTQEKILYAATGHLLSNITA